MTNITHIPRMIVMALCAVLLAACVPADVPPQLSHTPGAPVVIADQVYRAPAFSVRYPAGWQIITSAAGDPPAVIFVAPGEQALIIVGTVIDDAPPLPGQTRTERREINGVTAILRATADEWDNFTALFARIAESISLQSG